MAELVLMLNNPSKRGGKMRKLSIRITVAAAVVAGVSAVGVPAAMAGGASRTCNAPVCIVYANGFPGGTISVDADSHGTGTASWILNGPNGYSCGTEFPRQDPPRSWICRNAPAGNYSARVARGVPTTNIGIRW